VFFFALFSQGNIRMTMLETLAASTDPIVVLLPKNRGLVERVDRWLRANPLPDASQYVRVRGEDVPMLADQMARAGRSVLAFTGDDLLDEWLALGNALSERIERDRIAWNDPVAIYGAPALSLIGPPNEPLAPGAPMRRVAVCARYKALASRFIRIMARDAIALEAVIVSGAVETFVANGVADLAIDIVVTGKTLARAGLAVRRVISTSDLAVLEAR
jgi:ATP phosphoribosyltransferase